MIQRLIKFISDRRDWINSRKEWRGYDALNKDMLSRLQLECLESARSNNVIKSHRTITDPEVNPENIGKVIILESHKPGVYFSVYNGEAYLEGNNEFYHIEESGCKTPAEFISEVVSKLKLITEETKNA